MWSGRVGAARILCSHVEMTRNRGLMLSVEGLTNKQGHDVRHGRDVKHSRSHRPKTHKEVKLARSPERVVTVKTITETARVLFLTE